LSHQNNAIILLQAQDITWDKTEKGFICLSGHSGLPMWDEKETYNEYENQQSNKKVFHDASLF